MSSLNYSTVCMFDLEFSNMTLDEGANCLVDDSKAREPFLVVTPNVDHVVKLVKDSEMKKIFSAARYRFADGMPIVWLSRVLMSPLKARVTGADMLVKVAEVSVVSQSRIFLLGGRPGVAEMAANKLRAKFAGVEISGVYSPPFGFEYDVGECKKIIGIINESKSNILFVGLGAPKQEKWAYEYMNLIQVGAIVGVGAAFDFAAGTIGRCPTFFQNIGCEWIWRLLQEPRRLGRRYLIEDVTFINMAVKEILKRYSFQRFKK